MDQALSYVVIGQARARESRTRIALALFMAAAAYALAPSVWPVIWFAVVMAVQALDAFLYRPILARPDVEPSQLRQALCVASASLSASVFSAVTLYFWFEGGQAGQIFALIQAASGLLQVTLHMHHVRPALFGACLPHALCFFGLPIFDAAIGGFENPLAIGVVTIGGLIYVLHLTAAVRQSTATTQAIRHASDRAEVERAHAERASAAKSDFLATVSHEIRTPMNAVISAGNLLKRTPLTPEQAEHVAILEHAGEVLVGLLTDVLDISKIEAGKMTMEVADVCLREKLEGLVSLWRPRADAKGVDLQLQIDPRLPTLIRTDPLRMQQILFNLLSNAVKFTEAGRVEVSADVLESAEGPLLSITISDTGCGISEDALERIFASFEQAEAGTTRQYGGTGLGLAISRRLTELMDGTLTVESRLGFGSSFSFEIPLVTAVAVESLDLIVAERHAIGDEPLAVLVAEDHEVNRRIVALLLEPMGFSIDFAVNGHEAVEAARLRVYDVILMDMQMPIMDGIDATRALRSGGGPNAHTPVVALTANAMDHHRATWANVGVRTFLTKPIDPAALVQALLTAGRPPATDGIQLDTRAAA